jgi:hypothetical protein
VFTAAVILALAARKARGAPHVQGNLCSRLFGFFLSPTPKSLNAVHPQCQHILEWPARTDRDPTPFGRCSIVA